MLGTGRYGFLGADANVDIWEYKIPITDISPDKIYCFDPLNIV